MVSANLEAFFQSLQEFLWHIEEFRTFHRHLGARPFNRNGLAQIAFDGCNFRVDVWRIGESNLSGSLQNFRLLNEDVIGVL